MFKPLLEYQKACLFVLVTIHGAHTHPIPLPSKTPELVHLWLMTFLRELEEGLPDLTPQWLLRHPALHPFLKTQLPGIVSPVLSDFHISLANHSHLNFYINEIKKECFPNRTGWDGVFPKLLLSN